MSHIALLSRPMSFIVASLSFVTIFITAGSPIPLFNIYQSDYGISNTDLGVISAVYFVAAAIALLILGRLSDYLGRKPLSIVALSAAMLSCILLYLWHDFWTLFFARLLQGLACGLGAGALTAYIVDTSSVNFRWLATVMTSSSPMIGIPIGAIACGFLILMGTETQFLIYEIVAVLLAILIVLTCLGMETVRPRQGAIQSLIPQLYMPKSELRLLLIASAVFLATWSIGGFYQAYGPAIAHQYLGTSNPVLAALVFAAIMLLTPLGSPLSRAFSAKMAVNFGMVLFILSMLMILASLHFAWVVTFIVASLAVGLAQGLAVTGAMGRLIDSTEQQQRAGLLSTIYLIAYCSAAIPALIASHFAKNVPLFEISIGYAVLGIVSAVFALSLVRKI